MEFEGSRHTNGVPPVLIRWVAEGTFYRAYEWSAWLACRYVSQFNARRKNLKGFEPYAFVGFPVSSLEKYTAEAAELVKSENGGVVDMLLPSSTLDQNVPMEEYTEQFNNWKQSLAFVEGGKAQSISKDLRDSLTTSEPMRISSILQQVLSFPIEQKSPMESMAFLAEIKQKIANSI